MTHEYASTVRQHNGVFKVITIDTAKARLFGIPWLTLGDYGKRKFENLLVLKDSKERLKIRYL